MTRDVDAVIAALKVALQEAERSDHLFWKVRASNRWIAQLPGAALGRWRHLKLVADHLADETGREDFIGHVRATIAYLETNREAIRSMRRWSWPLQRAKPQTAVEPIDAEFEDVTPVNERMRKPRKNVRIIK